MRKSDAPAGRALWQRSWVRGLFLVAVTLLVYHRLWHAGFIWDDSEHLTQNPVIIGPLGFRDIWTSSQAYYYPLVLTSFWVIHKFLDLNPLPYQNAERLAVRKKREAHGEDLRAHGDNYTPLHAEAREQLTWT